jgi:anti-sigma28 factor (negative regulator of flagellin synthesis)
VSRDERLIRKAMSIHDVERERFVEDLKQAVWNGTYDPSAEEIADALITERCSERCAKI